jgi:hypothetical protein
VDVHCTAFVHRVSIAERSLAANRKRKSIHNQQHRSLYPVHFNKIIRALLLVKGAEPDTKIDLREAAIVCVEWREPNFVCIDSDLEFPVQ